MNNASGAVLLLLVIAFVAAGSAAGGGETVRWFHSPSGNIQCEVASHDRRGTYAYCQTFKPLQWARLTRDGRTRVCSHRRCAVGNGPENATTLAYNRSLRVGIFSCSSSKAGIVCVIARTGYGFGIARAGVTRF